MVLTKAESSSKELETDPCGLSSFFLDGDCRIDCFSLCRPSRLVNPKDRHRNRPPMTDTSRAFHYCCCCRPCSLVRGSLTMTEARTITVCLVVFRWLTSPSWRVFEKWAALERRLILILGSDRTANGLMELPSIRGRFLEPREVGLGALIEDRSLLASHCHQHALVALY